jgi:LPXTG-motif cell wall-anchored protein
MTAQNQTTTQPSTTQGQSTMAPATTGNTNDNSSANRSMPNTSAGWLMMLLSGGALSGAGFSLRRKR